MGPPGPFLLRRYLLGTYDDPRNLTLARVPTKLPTIFDFGFPGSNSGFALRECALAIAQAVGGKLSLDERF